MSLFNNIASNPNQRSECANGQSCGETESTLKPAFEVSEKPEAWSLTVQLPGVARDGLEFTAEDTQVTIRGRRGWSQPEGWTTLHRESADAPFELVLEHEQNLDLEKIQAELKDGVLRVTLPKNEAVKPRKITIN